ncbi:MAG TPA: Holliday junction branch migration protein RuvA [Patescibacteria group bacterium]|nr:Holliday junction branch migration protein RuvA [Patescibacteria group bacterium]
MISYIKGQVKFKEKDFIILENNDIGYKIFVPSELLIKLEPEEEIKLFTFQNVKEDALDLFGFMRWEELRLFEQLISVSGVGPKTALAVFAEAEVEDIVSAIVNGDPSILKKVSGIGAKTAERLILELKNKVSASVSVADLKSAEDLGADSEAVEALVALGYSAGQANQALKKVDKNLKDVGEKVRQALRNI